MRCAATPLLRPGAHATLTRYRAQYLAPYDDVFWEVHTRLHEHGFATKLDLGALITWKHTRTAVWMRTLNLLDESTVRSITGNAFGASTTEQAVAALRPLPGFGAGLAYTSVLLAAWDPERFGVYDKFAVAARARVVAAQCSCTWDDLITYEDHLRQIAGDLSTHATPWTPREVDMALYGMGAEADAAARKEARRQRREEKKAQREQIA